MLCVKQFPKQENRLSYLERREMAKKNSAENGGFRRERRLKPPKPTNTSV